MRLGTLFLTSVLALSLSGCATYDFSRKIVQQGNLLPQSKIQRLHLGMSKEDAGILMGNSLLSPTFNNNRWDYAYTRRKGNGAMLVCNLSLYFANGRLTRIEKHP